MRSVMSGPDLDRPRPGLRDGRRRRAVGGVEAAAAEASVVDLDERKRIVLRAVVTEYVATGQPVGSAHVVAAANLEVSAATVRSDMGALEELGLIAQPHTSAGRSPPTVATAGSSTTCATRQRSTPVSARSSRSCSGPRATSRTCSPARPRCSASSRASCRSSSHRRSRRRACASSSSSALGPLSALLLLVSDTGRVEKHTVELPVGGDERDLDRVRSMLADRLVGRRFGDVGTVLRRCSDEAPSDLRAIVRAVADAAVDVREDRVHQVFVGGQSALADDLSLQRDELSRLLQLLEERDTLARLLEEAAQGPDEPAPDGPHRRGEPDRGPARDLARRAALPTRVLRIARRARTDPHGLRQCARDGARRVRPAAAHTRRPGMAEHG
jgi:heat-inducible transcriptional repressor